MNSYRARQRNLAVNPYVNCLDSRGGGGPRTHPSPSTQSLCAVSTGPTVNLCNLEGIEMLNRVIKSYAKINYKDINKCVIFENKKNTELCMRMRIKLMTAEST
jgi:hypothetical protein